jgi:hypothetical protein
MKCPKCFGPVRVCDTTYTEENEIYRRKRCRNCGSIVYTLEFEVENNSALQEDWNRLLKTAKPAWTKRKRKIYTIYLVENGEIVASGTSEECAKKMGISAGTFRGKIAKINKGKTRKYEVEIQYSTDKKAEE